MSTVIIDGICYYTYHLLEEVVSKLKKKGRIWDVNVTATEITFTFEQWVDDEDEYCNVNYMFERKAEDRHADGDIKWATNISYEVDDGDDAYEDSDGNLQENWCQWIDEKIVHVREQREAEVERIEAEILAELERKRQEAIDAVQKAFKEAENETGRYEFETAEDLLKQCRADVNTAEMQNELSDMQNQIKLKKEAWIQNEMNEIHQLISNKKFSEAGSRLDQIDSRRITATGRNKDFDGMYRHLNRSEAEEKERIQKLKEANRKKALEISRNFTEYWDPRPTHPQIKDGVESMIALQDAILKSTDGPFLQKEGNWRGDEKVKEAADKAWKNGTRIVLQNALNDAIEMFSRENVFTNNLLANGYKDSDEWRIATLSSFIKKIDPVLGDLFIQRVHMFSLTPKDKIMSSFIHRFLKAESEYVEEVKRENNKLNALKIVGNLMGVSEEKDFATEVEERYRGNVSAEFYVEDDSNPTGRRFVGTEDVKQMIEEGENLIIVLEECYDTDEQNELGHLNDEDTEQHHGA